MVNSTQENINCSSFNNPTKASLFSWILIIFAFRKEKFIKGI